MSDLAKQLIEKEKRERTGKLDLGKCGLTDLEKQVPELFDLEWLEDLNLCNHWMDWEEKRWINSPNIGQDNRLQKIPPPLSQLIQLKQLQIGESYKGNWHIRDEHILEKLTNLQSLNLSYISISNYSFLEEFKGLQRLNLYSCQISNLNFIKKLTGLLNLDLSCNKISNIKYLEKLIELQVLDFSRNNISDISTLAKLTKLRVLDLSRNNISEIQSLEKLKGLQSLKLNYNQINTINSLEMLEELQTLELNSNLISKISSLERLKKLQSLDLCYNQIISSCSFEGLTKLQSIKISSVKISDYSFLRKLIGLRSIDLSYNEIIDCSFIENLKELRSLDLSHNNIFDTHFLKNHVGLQIIRLSSNQISDIYPLEKLTGLTSLDLSSNQISDIHPLEKLTGLTSLDLSSNQISDIHPLEKLTGLTSLDLSSNQISDIHPLEKLTGLTTLNLRSNQISDVRFLEKLIGLQNLNLGRNQISDIRNLNGLVNLENLDLNYNKISDISSILSLIFKGLSVMTNNVKSGIHIYNNPLTVPPPEVLENGDKAVLRYFEELERSGSYKIMETRLLIVGQGGAGKTSLLRKLKNVDEPMPEKGDTTRGIDILPLTLKTKEGEDFTLHIWDFGGQNIQHYAHQFFLTGSSLYVLVHNQREQNTNFQYWLNIIEMLGAASPVIILQNEVAGHREPLDNAATIRDRFNNVVEPFFQVDLWNAATDSRFEPLKETIAAIASNSALLPHFGTTRPGSFVRVRKKLKPLVSEHQFITWKQFIKVCKEERVTNPDLLNDYGNIFTVLGIFLHFPNDLELRNFIFLRPKWIIDALFTLLYHDIVVNQKKGEFTEMDTLQIWQGKEYEQMHGKLIRLMENFELCYPVTDRNDRRFIVPQRLPSSGSAFPWGEEDTVRVIFRYKFMPRGIITRLTCRLHRLIEDGHVWSDAVIFHKKGTKNRIFVRERFAEDEIWIESAGPNRSDLLNKVVETIDAIHEESKFANLRVSKLVPCDCSQCQKTAEPYLFDYDYLVSLMSDGEIQERCQKSRIKVEIRTFLAKAFENGDNPPAYIVTMQQMVDYEFRKIHQVQDRLYSLVENLFNDLAQQIAGNTELLTSIDRDMAKAETLAAYMVDLKETIGKIGEKTPAVLQHPSTQELLNPPAPAVDLKGKFKFTWQLFPKWLADVHPLIPNMEAEIEATTDLKAWYNRIANDYMAWRASNTQKKD